MMLVILNICGKLRVTATSGEHWIIVSGGSRKAIMNEDNVRDET
jgi:hypothetical protein